MAAIVGPSIKRLESARISAAEFIVMTTPFSINISPVNAILLYPL
jgi:hypothetical protein